MKQSISLLQLAKHIRRCEGCEINVLYKDVKVAKKKDMYKDVKAVKINDLYKDAKVAN